MTSRMSKFSSTSSFAKYAIFFQRVSGRPSVKPLDISKQAGVTRGYRHAIVRRCIREIYTRRNLKVSQNRARGRHLNRLKVKVTQSPGQINSAATSVGFIGWLLTKLKKIAGRQTNKRSGRPHRPIADINRGVLRLRRLAMLPPIMIAAIATILARPIHAETWPARPLTMVVPFVAGGPMDAVARILQSGLSDALRQQVIIENVGELENYDLTSLETLAYGGSPMAPELIHRIREVLPNVKLLQGYGLSETCFLSGLLDDEHTADRLMSCGRTCPGIDLRIMDESGKELEAGSHGELAARGANVMRGYWNNLEETKQAFRDDFFHTGDFGYRDSNGYF
jgi:AMP-binding enzyme